MNLYEFFTNPRVQLPLVREVEENDYLIFVKTRLLEYLDLLDKLDAPDSINSELESQKPSIKDSRQNKLPNLVLH